MISVCRFRDDAPCAYSMTYDEGFIDVLANALPIHERYGFPGHVDVVVGQLGQRRNCFRSSMNGLLHMGVEDLKFLLSVGWSVGNHSWSHFVYPNQPGLDLYHEIVYSKYALEDKLGVPITFMALPNDTYNYAPARPYVEQAGYTGFQHIEGGVNYDDVDLLKIGNFIVGSGPISPRPGWPETLRTDHITVDAIRDGWLCETTHLVQPDPIQPRKNLSCADLARRFEKLLEITDGRLWRAVPEDVVDYIALRRSISVSQTGSGAYRVDVQFPVGIRNRCMTFKASDADERTTSVLVEGQSVPFRRFGGNIIFTVEDLIPSPLSNSIEIKLSSDNPEDLQ